MSSYKFIIPVLFVLTVSFVPVLYAQEAPQSIVVPEIEVSGNPLLSDVPVRESSSTASIDDSADMEAPGGPAVGMSRESAVVVRQAGGAGQAASVSIRGSDPRSTLVSLDGVPLNSPFMGGADIGALGILTLDSVDTVRGGQSSIRGTDASGGTVDARTPSPLEGNNTRASFMAGSFGTYRLKAAHSHLFDKRAVPVGLYVSGGFLHSGGQYSFTDSNGVSRIREHNAATAFEGLIKVEAEPAAGHTIKAMAEVFRDDREVAGLEQFPSTTAFQKDTRSLARLAWEGPALFGIRGTTTASAYFRLMKFDYSDDLPPMGPAQRTSLTSTGGGAKFMMLAAPWKLVAFRFGLDGSYEYGQVNRVGQQSYTPDRGLVAGTVGLVVGSPSDPWQISSDVRLEYDSGFGFRAVPGLGVWYEPHSLVRLTANVGRSFRLPTLEELYFDTGFVQGSPDLDPEDSLTWDAGIEVGRGRPWSLKVSYFENYVFNMIMFAPVSAFLIRADNSGSAVMRGVETQAGVKWKWLELKAAYTFLFSKFTDTGNELPARPAHVFSGTVGFVAGPFKLSVMPSWQSQFYLDTFESLYEEARFRLDARLEIKPRPWIAIVFDFNNLTNKTDAVDYLQQPLPGFAAFGSVRLDL
jgi:outer membrane cobalamin receptor